jgi:hypothetical protein
MVTDATLDHLERDEALDIGAELSEIFSRRAAAVLLQRTINHTLRQGWIERPARTVSHKDARVATCTVVALVRTGGQDQRSTGRRQAELNCVEDLALNVGTVVPETVRFAAIPPALVEINPGWRSYEYFVVQEEIIIIDPPHAPDYRSSRDLRRRYQN